MQIIRQEEVKAKKQYKCNYCCELIEVGERYNYAYIKYEGYTYPWRSHLHCIELASKLGWFDEGPVTEDDFWEHVGCEFDKLEIDNNRRFTFKEKLDEVLKHNHITKQK